MIATSEFLMIMALILSLIGALAFWQMRSFGFAALAGLLFAATVFVIMNSSLGDQLRKEAEARKTQQAAQPA